MKKLFIIFTTLLTSLTFLYSYNNETTLIINAETETDPPVITILENDLEIYEDEEINLFDYVDVQDESNVEVDIEIKDDSFSVGNHVILVKATDENGNRSTDCIRLTIKSIDEINNYVKKNSDQSNFQDTKNDSLLEEKGHADLDAFELAQQFIGMKGSCATVAQAFINKYFGNGYDVLNTYSITAEEAEPGDIIFYTNSGFGQQHYAVYLGGSSALHGNINGTTVVSYVYMNYGSTPQFRRLKGR